MNLSKHPRERQVDMTISFESRKRDGLQPFKRQLAKNFTDPCYFRTEFWSEVDDAGTTHLHAIGLIPREALNPEER